MQNYLASYDTTLAVLIGYSFSYKTEHTKWLNCDLKFDSQKKQFLIIAK